MICEKKEDAEDAKTHHSCENFRTSWIAFAMFFGICWIGKKMSKKEQSLKHAVVNNNKFKNHNGIRNDQFILSQSQHVIRDHKRVWQLP